MGMAIWSYVRIREAVFQRYPATAFQRFWERMEVVRVPVGMLQGLRNLLCNSRTVGHCMCIG